MVQAGFPEGTQAFEVLLRVQGDHVLLFVLVAQHEELRFHPQKMAYVVHNRLFVEFAPRRVLQGAAASNDCYH